MTQSSDIPSLSSELPTKNPRILAIWLLCCCAMIYGMVVIGGVTRLTQSGLSMVEWKPILGVIPPINQGQWQAAFAKYQQYPEYKIRRNMTLDEFKGIYYIEWFHRVFGRLIGLVFGLPLVFFWWYGFLNKTLLSRLIWAFVLGGMQGILGWYMVKSGLVDKPHVSPYRLTAHLLLAVFLFAYVLWLALDLAGWRQKPKETPLPLDQAHRSSLVRWNQALVILIFVMIGSGGLVAGTRAGFAFNTWPLMVGQVIPEGLMNYTPWYTNFVNNTLTIQFTHRTLAYLLCLLIPIFWWKLRNANIPSRLRIAAHGFLASLGLQVLLGILTLLYIVPISLAALHQAGAVLLLTMALLCLHALYPRENQP